MWKKRVLTASVAVAFACATGAALADVITFDPTGTPGASGDITNANTFDWKPGNALAVGSVPVTVGDTFELLYQANLGRVQQLIAAVVQQPWDGDSRPCRSALRGALVTPRERLTAAQREILAVLES